MQFVIQVEKMLRTMNKREVIIERPSPSSRFILHTTSSNTFFFCDASSLFLMISVLSYIHYVYIKMFRFLFFSYLTINFENRTCNLKIIIFSANKLIDSIRNYTKLFDKLFILFAFSLSFHFLKSFHLYIS